MSETSSQEITKDGGETIDLDAIRARNELRRERISTDPFSTELRHQSGIGAKSSVADIDALLAEVERLTKPACPNCGRTDHQLGDACYWPVDPTSVRSR
jgi:hypothetical protein